jgi:hypothetical protein
MARTYDMGQNYIQETRQRQNRQIYSAFERFVSTLPGRTPPPAESPGAGSTEGPDA